jgi:hypothetical protein
VIPPDNAWLKRSNNDIIIGCYSSQQTWQLKCDGHEWKGHVGTCPELYVGPVISEEEKIQESPTFVLYIVIAIAITTLIICLTVICVGCLCLKRYRPSTVKKPVASSLLNDTSANSDRTFSSNGGNTFVHLPQSAGTQLLKQQPAAETCRDERHQLMLPQPGNAVSTQYFVLDNEQMA